MALPGGARRGAAGFGNHWLNSGLPFLAFMGAGSVGLGMLLQGRTDVRDAKAEVTDLRAPAKTQKVRKRNSKWSLEEETKKTNDKFLEKNDESFELVRLPRPGEEDGGFFDGYNKRGWWGSTKRLFGFGAR
mmetsp:Transcript_1885/g.4266  ORF Transcript_1885/g.4266 Transcript_1885/m.4266 type:complete len:131 (+) Transcript_1885:157-549(+)|eukprot:CAMPEP_0197593474 /NCGR_PEP_ID=MMETSP1326-20131121/18258_1 /TAXON_ID=1155430 /ORGANISM="Genus nov. species nov., Strain RCC2288" /LENGTH=130 /DNA_ID=CAMNT_0043159451 /DNA_START=145 /DNA_END=537 /DNA_ORIENTATION=+